MILPKKRITKALIRLHGYAGWSAPLLFANPEDRFSRVEAHFMIFQRYFHNDDVFILNVKSNAHKEYAKCH